MGFGSWQLTSFADSLWTAATPIRFAGMSIPHVMTVVRLADGRLLLHSPCAPASALVDEIAQLGSVAYIVAPNWFHDLYLRECRQTYPDAAIWGPPALRRQFGPEIIDNVLDETARPPWLDELYTFAVPGLLTFDESIFFHAASKTLIVADLFTNLSAGPDAPSFTRLMYGLGGVEGRLTQLPYLRWFGFTVRQSLRKAAQQILEWAPDRLIVGHGTPIATGAAAPLKEVCQRLLD